MIGVMVAHVSYAAMQTAWTIRDRAPLESVARTAAYHLLGIG